MNPSRGSLFGSPTPDLARRLEEFEAALTAAFPLRTRHRAALPGGIRRLSEQLTIERDDLPRDYMARPDSLAAYLHWFLPWNLYRQGLLLQGLGLDLPAGCRIVDLGAGPLTFALALWMALPALRDRNLQYTALDRAEPALQAGRDLFAQIAGAKADTWRLRTQRALAGRLHTGEADLLVAANLLNEMDTAARGRRGPGGQDEEGLDSAVGEAESRLLSGWEKAIAPDGALLVIEPGTRPGGRALTRLRLVALQRGWRAAAPCPHQENCPQPGIRGLPWCHFTFESGAAPKWLHQLAREVRLPKERASLSFLLLMRPDCRIRIAPPPRPRAGEGLCLVASEAFALPGRGTGRYGCSERGLVLLEQPGAPPRQPEGPQPGDLLVVRWPEPPQRDPKSGALVLPRSGAAGSAPAAPRSERRERPEPPKRAPGPPRPPRRKGR